MSEVGCGLQWRVSAVWLGGERQIVCMLYHFQ